MKWLIALQLFLLAGSVSFAETLPVDADVQQPDINGSSTGAQLGSPFGQSFVASSTAPLYGIGLAAVGISSLRDLHFQLWRTDATGAALVGDPLASGNITAAEIASFAPGDVVATPIWFPVYFAQAYVQTPGERLAFTIEGGNEMEFYFGNGTTYIGGRLLGDPSRDLTFVTIVPEPSTFALIGIGLVTFAAARRRTA